MSCRGFWSALLVTSKSEGAFLRPSSAIHHASQRKSSKDEANMKGSGKGKQSGLPPQTLSLLYNLARLRCDNLGLPSITRDLSCHARPRILFVSGAPNLVRSLRQISDTTASTTASPEAALSGPIGSAHARRSFGLLSFGRAVEARRRPQNGNLARSP